MRLFGTAGAAVSSAASTRVDEASAGQSRDWDDHHPSDQGAVGAKGTRRALCGVGTELSTVEASRSAMAGAPSSHLPLG